MNIYNTLCGDSNKENFSYQRKSEYSCNTYARKMGSIDLV